MAHMAKLPDYTNMTYHEAIRIAIINDDDAKVNSMLENGYDVNDRERHPRRIRTKPELLRLAPSRRTGARESSWPLLVTAAAHYKIRWVIILMELGANVDDSSVFYNNMTALMTVVQRLRHTNFGDHRRGGEDYQSDGPDELPEHKLALALVHILLFYGADPDTQQGLGSMSALHKATLHYDSEMVRLLIDCGAQVNLENTDGVTARQLANKAFIEEGDCESKDSEELDTIKYIFKLHAKHKLHTFGRSYAYKSSLEGILNRHGVMDQNLYNILGMFGHVNVE